MTDLVCWLDVVEYEQATPDLKDVYDGVRSSDGRLHNLYQGFSLRPHTIKPADDLYLAALHHADNTLPKWFSELIGVYVAILSGCDYAEAHHGNNYLYLLGDEQEGQQVLADLKTGTLENCGTEKEVIALGYVRKLTLEPQSVVEKDVCALIEAGWDHGEILEIVQIVAMFSYFIRVINGVGISLGNEKLGLY